MNYLFFQNRPARMTAEFVRGEYDALLARIDGAESAGTSDEWLKLYADWNALKGYISGEWSRTSYAFAKTMNDPALESADSYIRREVGPVASDGDFTMTSALLRSRHRGAIGGEHNRHLMRVYENELAPLAPVNRDLRVRVSDLAQRYSKIAASAGVTIDGEEMTLQRAGTFLSSDDRAVRRRAFDAVRAWHLEQRRERADIFNEMVNLRHRMAANVGYDTFTPLGYLGMERMDYGPDDVAGFRESVRRHAVPLQTALYQRQRDALNVDTLRPWDSPYDPTLTLPPGIVPVETQLDTVGRIFDALSPLLGEHFMKMRDGGWIDLENRKGKRGGAFCTSFADEGHPAILCNSVGDADDVRTLVHEMGHAFQGWESGGIEDVTLRMPSADACEIHSLGMEMLSLRYIDRFFSPEHAEKFRRGRWKKSVQMLCYISIVDEFQHWVYENPDATIDGRDDEWERIWDIYRPGIDYAEIEDFKRTIWYGQAHIFRSPFYYIDYAIAETGAMQLALIDAEDHDRAMGIYMDLCRIGGTMSVLDIFKAAGLRSPFDPDVMRDLMAHAARELAPLIPPATS
ncbi:MAG: M3 family oligoendopeptidase [Candidatus Kapaibacterium sp.]